MNVLAETTITPEILDAGWRERQAAHNREIDEMIAAGWGDTPRNEIPANWRDVPGPDTEERRVLRRDTAIENRRHRQYGKRRRLRSVVQRRSTIQGGY